TAGYLLFQNAVQKDTPPAEDHNSMNHQSSDSASVDESGDDDEWVTYENDTHGFAFDYPADWNVEVSEHSVASEPRISLVNPNGERRLGFYVDAAMGCEEMPTGDEEETTLLIAETEVMLAKDCNQSWGFIQAQPATGSSVLTITPGDFLGSPEEAIVREVLKTVEGLTVIEQEMEH